MTERVGDARLIACVVVAMRRRVGEGVGDAGKAVQLVERTCGCVVKRVGDAGLVAVGVVREGVGRVIVGVAVGQGFARQAVHVVEGISGRESVFIRTARL